MIERTATELIRTLSHGDISAEDLTSQSLQPIRKREPQVRAFLHTNEAATLERARALDQKRKRGDSLGPLAGLPVAFKDVLCTAGMPTTCGSKNLQNFVPPYDAHVEPRLL